MSCSFHYPCHPLPWAKSSKFQWLATRGLLVENLSGLAILNAQHFKLILRPDVKVSGATEGDDNTLDGSIGKTKALHPQDKVTPPRKDSHLPSPLHFSWCLPSCLLPPSMFSFFSSSLLPPPVSQAVLQLFLYPELPWTLDPSASISQVLDHRCEPPCWAPFLSFLNFLGTFILFRKPSQLELAERRIHPSRKSSDIHIKHSQDPLGIWGKPMQERTFRETACKGN